MKAIAATLSASHASSPRVNQGADQGADQPCEVCGSGSVFTDEVASPAPTFRTLLLSECKRCHHRWTGALLAPQLVAAPQVFSLSSPLSNSPAQSSPPAHSTTRVRHSPARVREVALAS